jgi:hypothetical protein
MTVIAIPLVCAIIGALLYLLLTSASTPFGVAARELGRLLFFAAILVIMLYAAGHVLKIGVSP